MASEAEQRTGGPSFSNLGYVEDLYLDYLRDPESVEPTWRAYFQGLAAGGRPATYEELARPEGPFPRRRTGDGRSNGDAVAEAGPGAGPSQEALPFEVDRLVQAYREHGHLHARLDPLGLERRDTQAELGLVTFGLSEADLDRPVRDDVTGSRHTLRELVAHLKETYCRTVGVELAHLHDMDLRSWLTDRMERTRNHITLTPDTERFLLRKLTEAELFEQF